MTLSNKTTYTADEENVVPAHPPISGRMRHLRRGPREPRGPLPGLPGKAVSPAVFRHGTGSYRPAALHPFLGSLSRIRDVLIHHLDALVFSDQLASGVTQVTTTSGPRGWSVAIHPTSPNRKWEMADFPCGVKVESALRVLNSQRCFVDPDEYWRHYAARTPPVRRLLNYPRKYLKRLPALNNARGHIETIWPCRLLQTRATYRPSSRA